MKFKCSQCGTAYSVPDERIRGKRIRIQCKRCNAPIVVTGPPAGSSASAGGPGHRPPPPAKGRTQLGLGLPSRPGGLAAAPPSQAPQATAWSVAVTRSDRRKMTPDEIADAARQGLISRETLVWKSGMSNWSKLGEVAELASRLEPAPPPPPASADDFEDEATRVLDPDAVRPRPSAPAPPSPAKPAERAAPAEPPAPSPKPSAAEASDFDDEDETTSLIAPDRAQALLQSKPASTEPASTEPASTKPASTDFDADDEITAVVDPAQAKQMLEAELSRNAEPSGEPSSEEQPESGEFDDEDEITRVASSESAKDLLLGVAKAEKEPENPDEPERPSFSQPHEAPTVVVSEQEESASPAVETKDEPEKASDERSRQPKPEPQKAKISPEHLAMQHEPTRIVRVKKGPSWTTLIVAFLVVAIASAAGGFVASRFLSRPPPARSR